MPKPQISHVIMVVDAQGRPYPGLITAVPPEDAGDDTQYRLGLMSVFAHRCLTNTGIEIKTISQIWTFWEQFALPSGVSFAFLEGSAPPAAVTEPPSEQTPEPPAPEPEGDMPAPTTLDTGHA